MGVIKWLKREPIVVTKIIEKIVEIPADPQHDLKKRLEAIDAPQEVKEAYLALDADLLTADWNTGGLLCSEFWGTLEEVDEWPRMQLDAPTQVQVPPRGALFQPRPLNSDERSAVRLAVLTDGVTIRPPLKKKLQALNKGPYRVVFDQQGNIKPVKPEKTVAKKAP